MALKENGLWTRGRQVRAILVALLAVIFIGGSLFYVAAQRSISGPVQKQIPSRPDLNALPAASSGILATSSSYLQSLYCASDDGRRHYCNADTRDGVSLVRQRSGSACIQGRTWGYDRSGIWVDRGCRADFEVGYRDNRGRDNNRGRDRDYDRGRGRDVQTFYCESGDMKRHWCSEGIGGDVRLIRQRSGSPCIQGRTWGRDRSGVWVDRGCRADFEVTRR